MSPSRRAAFLALLLAPLAACRSAPAADAGAPDVEFIVAAGDSSYWVSADTGAPRVRGAPIQLARVDGRFFELYVADEDLSYENAVLVGQRVYRRDLLTGDSLLVFADTLVPALAARYTRLHPLDRRLAPDEPESDDPRWRATATIELVETHGTFASFTLHTDVERDDDPLWHTSRSGVIDLRIGRPVSLAEVAGSAAVTIAAARPAAEQQALDSVRRHAARSGRGAASVLANYRFDPASFTLASVHGAPAIAYTLPGAGEGGAGHEIPLSPIRFAEPAWWDAAVATRPIPSADGARDVWRRGRQQVLVRYDADGERGRLALRDSSGREWELGFIPAPARELHWLDAPLVDARTRLALTRAFDEAGSYDERVRSARWTAPRGTGPARTARRFLTGSRTP